MYALFGHPLSHSRSPEIYREFAAQQGREFDFRLIDVAPADFAAELKDFLRAHGLGANVTLPLKHAAFELAESASDRATLAGAANLLRYEAHGVLFADNTDGAGLVADLVDNLGVDLHGQRVLVVGAGGAARGIIGPLLSLAPSEVVIANRSAEPARLLAARFAALGRVHAAPLTAPGGRFDVVINATSASLDDMVPALPTDVFAPAALGYDLVYGDDGATAFTRWASANGAARSVDGRGMLIEQAAESWQVWFGERPDTGPLI